MDATKFVRVGVGIIVLNKDGKILIGKRQGSFSPYYSIPGGHVDMGETFEETAIREIQEEAGILIKSPRVYGMNNDLETHAECGRHYVSAFLIADQGFEGEVRVCEPNKCEGFWWMHPDEIPLPHYAASRTAIELWQKGSFYKAR